MVAVLQQGVVIKARIGLLSNVVAADEFAAASDGLIEDGGAGTATTTRRQREYMEGQILHSIGQQQWLVEFEDGIQRECHSRQLTFVYDPMFDIGEEETMADTTTTAINSNNNDDNNENENVDYNVNNADTLSDIEEEEDIDEEDIEEVQEGENEDDEDDIRGFDAIFEGNYMQYQNKRNAAEEEKQQMINNNYTITKKHAASRKSMTWRVIKQSLPETTTNEYEKLGVRGVDWTKFEKVKDNIKDRARKKKGSCASPSAATKNCMPFLDLFLTLWPGDWQEQLKQLNLLMQKEYSNKRKNGKGPKKINPVTPNEFLMFIGILIAAGPAGQGGKNLYQFDEDVSRIGLYSVLPFVNFDKFISYHRFNDIRAKFHYAFYDLTKNDPSLPTYDPWYPISKLVAEFNSNRFETVAASKIKVLDESMSAWRPRKDKTGGLPNISFIKRKPEPLGSEFKTLACGVSGIMLYLEIQRGKAEMPKRSQYHHEFGATASCVVRCMKAMANCGQKEDAHRANIFYGDSWFASVKSADQVAEYGHDFVGPVKTATSLFVNKEIEKIMKEWPSGTHLVMEGTSPNDNKLLTIGYKYNKRKVLTFVATKNAGSTLVGEPYRARFIGDDNNIQFRSVDRPQIISAYFKTSNAVDKHNHARQAELKLEKHWVTLNCWFRLISTIIGINVVDCWKAYKQQFGGRMTVCKFAEQVSFELLHNNFSTSKASQEILSPMDTRSRRSSPRRAIQVHDENMVSPLTDRNSVSNASSRRARSELLWYDMMQLHQHNKNNELDGNGHPKRNRCKICTRKTAWICGNCNVYVCPNEQGKQSNNCYRKHIQNIHPKMKLNY